MKTTYACFLEHLSNSNDLLQCFRPCRMWLVVSRPLCVGRKLLILGHLSVVKHLNNIFCNAIDTKLILNVYLGVGTPLPKL